jgi:hypothetical protein
MAKHLIDLWMHRTCRRKARAMFWRSAILLFSLVLVATLLWGGCVACPQFFQAPLAAHSCCDPTGHCGAPGCPTQGKPCHFQQVELQQNLLSLTQLTAAAPLSLPFTPDMLGRSLVAIASGARPRPLFEPSHKREALLCTFLI